MSYCTRCGAYIPTGESACPACGYDEARERDAGGAARQYYSDTTKDPWDDRRDVREPWEKKEEIWEPWKKQGASASQGKTGSSGADGRRPGATGTDEQRLSVLSYVGPLFVLPLLLRKNDAFARFHANQGLVLFLLECLVGTIFGGGLLGVAGSLFCFYCLVCGVKSAAAGRMDRLPVIGGITLLK